MAMIYEYAILRVVPRPEREEYINAGIVLYCREAGYLRAKVQLDVAKLHTLDTTSDAELVQSHLESADRVCRGGEAAGALGELSARERFGRVAAVRNTVLQASRIHTGFTDDPERTLARLMSEYVL